MPDAIVSCQNAGVTIRMVTGDNLITARSIARKCGILTTEQDGGNILEGKTFHKLVHDDNGAVSTLLMIDHKINNFLDFCQHHEMV